MQRKTAFFALAAAFCAGVLVDRIYFSTPEMDIPISAVEPVPLPPVPTQSNVADSGRLTMHNCLISAIRPGMTTEQRVYACDEIVN